jgi:hypothetical protein
MVSGGGFCTFLTSLPEFPNTTKRAVSEPEFGPKVHFGCEECGVMRLAIFLLGLHQLVFGHDHSAQTTWQEKELRYLCASKICDESDLRTKYQ